MRIVLNLGNGETCDLDEDVSAALVYVARKQHRSIEQIVRLAIRQRIRALRTPAAMARIMAAVKAKDEEQARRAKRRAG